MEKTSWSPKTVKQGHNIEDKVLLQFQYCLVAETMWISGDYPNYLVVCCYISTIIICVGFIKLFFSSYPSVKHSEWTCIWIILYK